MDNFCLTSSQQVTFTKIAKIEIKNKVFGWVKFEFDANKNSIYWSGYYHQGESGVIDLKALNIQPFVQFVIKGNVRGGGDFNCSK